MKRTLYWFLIGLFIIPMGFSSYAQSKEVLTKNFKFNDGIYLTIEEWKRNEPSYSWEEVETRLASNPRTFVTQVEFIQPKGKEFLYLKEVWGICLSGIPYVRITQYRNDTEATAFAGLRVRGKISFFSYEQELERDVEIKAYNPLTKKPFRQGKVSRKERVLVEKMLHFENGLIEDFNYVNFLLWIEDDPKLKESVFDLSPSEIKEKLFKCLLIYDDRNLVYVGDE